MTLFTIDKDGKFAELNDKKQKSDSKELDLQLMVKKNPDSVFNNTKVMLIGRKVQTGTEEVIDFLGLDKSGNTVIIDLHGVKTKRKSLARLIEKAAWVDTLDYNDLDAVYKEFDEHTPDLFNAHTDFFETGDETTSWNKHVRLVTVSQETSPEFIQSAAYLRKNGLNLSCVLFNYHTHKDDLMTISREFVVGGDEFVKPDMPVSFTEPKTDKEKFFNSLDENGLKVFSQLLDFASNEGLEFKWTPQGFTLNVMVDSEAIGLCYGYAQDSLLNQSIYTGFDQILRKVNNAEEIVAGYITRLEDIELFNKTRSSYRWDIEEQFSGEEIQLFLDVLKDITEKIKEKGLTGIEADAPAF